MKKEDLAGKLAEKGITKTKKEGKAIIEGVFEVIAQELVNGEEIAITGFGKFATRIAEARVGRNPKTGEAVDIPSRRVFKFIPSKQLKDSLN